MLTRRNQMMVPTAMHYISLTKSVAVAIVLALSYYSPLRRA